MNTNKNWTWTESILLYEETNYPVMYHCKSSLVAWYREQCSGMSLLSCVTQIMRNFLFH